MDLDEMFQKGIALRNNGESEKAIAQFRSIINLFPNDGKIGLVYIVLAGIYSDLGNYEKAQTFF